MGDGIRIDADSVLAHSEQRILDLLGKDPASIELAEWFKSLQGTALSQSSVVQCVGMREPVPFEKIYQPTRLLLTGTGDNFAKPTLAEQGSSASRNRAAQSILAARALERHSISVQKFVELNQDATIFAGPGWGKTTFLQHIFRRFIRRFIQNKDVLPVLVLLRRPTAMQDLERFLQVAGVIKKAQRRDRILLLVDGYDEVSIEERKRVSDVLRRLSTCGSGDSYRSFQSHRQRAIRSRFLVGVQIPPGSDYRH